MMTTPPDIPERPEEPVLTVHNPSRFDLPVHTSVLEELLHIFEKKESVVFRFVELVYVDEERIVDINREYLGREYVTDIITFHYNDSDDTSGDELEGTLYCCAPRIAEQSHEVEADPDQEFYRIFIHGLLHLAGYSDSTSKEKENMTRLENHYLEYLSS